MSRGRLSPTAVGKRLPVSTGLPEVPSLQALYHLRTLTMHLPPGTGSEANVLGGERCIPNLGTWSYMPSAGISPERFRGSHQLDGTDVQKANCVPLGYRCDINPRCWTSTLFRCACREGPDDCRDKSGTREGFRYAVSHSLNTISREKGPRDASFGTRPQRFSRSCVYLWSPSSTDLSTAITQQQIWIAAIALIGLDLLFPVIPVMPLVAIYVLIAQPTWFKEFVDYVYRR
jgi:hypothetical protein